MADSRLCEVDPVLVLLTHVISIRRIVYMVSNIAMSSSLLVLMIVEGAISRLWVYIGLGSVWDCENEMGTFSNYA